MPAPADARFGIDEKMNFDFVHRARVPVALDASLSAIVRAELVRRLVEDEVAYLFKHALVQETAYMSLLRQDRKWLHQAVAETLERAYASRLDEYAPRLAQHYAEAGADAKTFEYAVRAADLAARQYAYVEARVYYAQALEAIVRFPDTAETRRQRVDTTLKQLRVTRLAVDPRENLILLEKAKALTQSLLQDSQAAREDRLRLGRVQYWSGTIHVMNNELADANDELEQALAVAREFDDPGLAVRASSVLAGVITLRGEFGKAVPLLTQLLDHHEKTGNWLEWVYTLAVLGYAHAAQGYYALGLAEGERAVARARELNNPTRLVEVLGTVVAIYFEGGDMPQFLAASQRALEGAEQLGERVYSFFYINRALAESRLGNADDAHARLKRDRASSLGGMRQTFWVDLLLAFEAEIMLNAGHPEEAISLAEQAVTIAKREGNLYGGGIAERTWAQALARLDPPCYEQAEMHLAESLRLFEQGDARLEAARTRVAWGGILRDRNATDAAREHFARAAAQFKVSGLTHELEETRARLHAVP